MAAPHDYFQPLAMVLFNEDILKLSRDDHDNHCVVLMALGSDS